MGVCTALTFLLQNNDQVHHVAPHLLPHLLHPDQEEFGFRRKDVKQQGVDDEEHVAQVREDGGVQLSSLTIIQVLCSLVQIIFKLLLIFKLIPPIF